MTTEAEHELATEVRSPVRSRWNVRRKREGRSGSRFGRWDLATMDLEPRAVSPEPHQPEWVDIHDSRPFYASWFVGMTALAFAVGTVPGLGPLLAMVFGIHAVWALSRLFARRPRIQITSEGIVDRNFWYSPGLIRWEEIIDVYSRGLGFIEVELKDETAFWERLSPLRQIARYKFQLFGYGPALITPWGLERSGSEVVDMLQAGLDEHVLQTARVEGLPPSDGGASLGAIHRSPCHPVNEERNEGSHN